MSPAVLIALGLVGVAATGGVLYWSGLLDSSEDPDELAALEEAAAPAPPTDATAPAEEAPVQVSLSHRLGTNFTLREFVRSTKAAELGIDNMPTPAAFQALGHLVRRVLQPLRDRLGVPVLVTSGYRSVALNDAVDGAESSQHVRGEAADVKSDEVSSADIARRVWNGVKEGWLDVDQVILYHPSRGGHVHLSFTTRRANRGQFLYAPEGGGYRSWSPS